MYFLRKHFPTVLNDNQFKQSKCKPIASFKFIINNLGKVIIMKYVIYSTNNTGWNNQLSEFI